MSIVEARASRAEISDAGLLFLKLAAFSAMVVDHVDWLLFDSAWGFHDTAGRLVFPLFAFVLALNLNRMRDSQLWPLVGRMVVVGALAHLPYTFLQDAALPLNVMATLALAVAAVAFWRMDLWVFAVGVPLLAGMFVDYAWFGLLAILVPYVLFRHGWSTAAPALAAGALLVPFNGSLWSLGVVLLVVAAHCLQGDAPRLKSLFYVGYPAHLAALAVIAWGMQ